MGARLRIFTKCRQRSHVVRAAHGYNSSSARQRLRGGHSSQSSGSVCRELCEVFRLECAHRPDAVSMVKCNLGELWNAPRPGAQRRWQALRIGVPRNLLASEPRSYNSQPLAQKLAQDRQVHWSADHFRRVLQKRG